MGQLQGETERDGWLQQVAGRDRGPTRPAKAGQRESGRERPFTSNPRQGISFKTPPLKMEWRGCSLARSLFMLRRWGERDSLDADNDDGHGDGGGGDGGGVADDDDDDDDDGGGGGDDDDDDHDDDDHDHDHDDDDAVHRPSRTQE